MDNRDRNVDEHRVDIRLGSPAADGERQQADGYLHYAGGHSGERSLPYYLEDSRERHALLRDLYEGEYQRADERRREVRKNADREYRREVAEEPRVVVHRQGVVHVHRGPVVQVAESAQGGREREYEQRHQAQPGNNRRGDGQGIHRLEIVFNGVHLLKRLGAAVILYQLVVFLVVVVGSAARRRDHRRQQRIAQQAEYRTHDQLGSEIPHLIAVIRQELVENPGFSRRVLSCHSRAPPFRR